jgi:hypothetical protein
VIIVHALSKKVVTAYRNDVANNPFKDWEDTLEVAVRLHRDDRLGIKLIVTYELEYKAPAVVVDEASAVAATRVVPVVATTPSQRGRRTTTNSMLVDMTPQLIVEAANRDYSTRLRLHWTCSNKACPYYHLMRSRVFHC